MKKLLIALTAGALTLIATAAIADAGQYVRYICGYDRCGHPVYSYRYVPTRSHNSYCAPSYGHNQYSGHSYHHNSRPSYSHSYSHGNRHGYSYSYSSRGRCR